MPRRSLAQTKKLARLRIDAADQAKDSLLDFTKFMMPDAADVEDPRKSRYQVARVHEAIAEACEVCESKPGQRLIINCPPRHGKTQLASLSFLPWFMGRNPQKSTIFGTYNEIYARKVGREIRETMLSSQYAQVFPDINLKAGAKSATRLELANGGGMSFAGRGGTVTGLGGHAIILDDPIKDAEEARSELIRENMWQWYNRTISTRLMDDTGFVLIIQCMTGDTPVLMADGTEKPLSEVRPGDQIATFEDGQITTSTVRNWKNQGPDNILSIKTKSGRTVRANARHPFLVERSGEIAWRRTATLKEGDAILRAITENGEASLAKPTGAISPLNVKGSAPRTTTKIAGREASAHLQSTLNLAGKLTSGTGMASTLRSTIASSLSKAASALSAKSHLRAGTPVRTGRGNSASTTVTTRGMFAGFCATIATLLSATASALKSSKPLPNTYGVTPDEIVEITPAGVEDVFDIEVERTENFIANGLISHNTRWHEDDLVGRLTDPENPHYLKAEARKWKIIDLPALAEQDDMLGRTLGEPLWPERFSAEWLNDRRTADPDGFSALYQGRPTVKEGSFFTTSMILEYDPATDLPPREEMEFYCTADLAVSINQNNDRTCLLTVGVDKHDNIYVMPDLVWTRIQADQIVEQMCRLMKTHDPVALFSEHGQITNTLGPFLRKRMAELDIHTHVSEIAPRGDKQSRAQAIMGRMAMGKVFFPRTAPWFQRAKEEMLKFPKSSRDDFVDALAYIGMALNQLRTGTKADPFHKARKGSFAEMFQHSNRQDLEAERRRERAQWGVRYEPDVTELN
jgi:predicted phage terminase large subunit-like protein